MRVLSLLTILAVGVTLMTAGLLLYPGPAFIAWSLSVVALGAGMQLLLRRRAASCETGSERRQETVIEVMQRGSFLRFYPPLPTAVALVSTVIVMNWDPGFFLAPLVIVMVGTAFWQRRNRG